MASGDADQFVVSLLSAGALYFSWHNMIVRWLLSAMRPPSRRWKGAAGPWREPSPGSVSRCSATVSRTSSRPWKDRPRRRSSRRRRHHDRQPHRRAKKPCQHRQTAAGPWMDSRAQESGRIGLLRNRTGRQVLIVIEPLHQQERIIGWIRLVFSVPQDVATARSNGDLARVVTLAVAPLFLLMATLLIFTLRNHESGPLAHWTNSPGGDGRTSSPNGEIAGTVQSRLIAQQCRLRAIISHPAFDTARCAALDSPGTHSSSAIYLALILKFDTLIPKPRESARRILYRESVLEPAWAFVLTVHLQPKTTL